MSEDADERYRAALEEHGLDDVRPLYRKLLVRLKKRDEAAYQEEVRRYREEVEPALDTADDPLAPWLRYGAGLARRLTPGRLTAVAPDGAATELEEESVAALPARTLLLHLPDDDGAPATPLAVPAEPSVHQEATRELLCG